MSLAESGMGLTYIEVYYHLMKRLQCSDVSRFFSYYFEQDGKHEFCLHLNGKNGDFWVGVSPDVAKICFMHECFWFATEGYRGNLAHQDVQDEVVYGGPIESATHAEVLDLLYETVRVLAGATGVFHDEVYDEERYRARALDFSYFEDCSYDVYVRNAHSRPYVKRLGNIAFHVNRDAAPEDWEDA